MSKRLRVFAGPNGSGKSTVKADVPTAYLGIYLNPDEIETAINRSGFYDLRGLHLVVTQSEINSFFAAHPLIEKMGEDFSASPISVANDGEFINFDNLLFNSYHSAILTDFLRRKLMEVGQSFTFETVMSSPDKIETLQRAQQAGFRTYLYYVATRDPAINVDRIKNRVRLGATPCQPIR